MGICNKKVTCCNKKVSMTYLAFLSCATSGVSGVVSIGIASVATSLILLISPLDESNLLRYHDRNAPWYSLTQAEGGPPLTALYDGLLVGLVCTGISNLIAFAVITAYKLLFTYALVCHQALFGHRIQLKKPPLFYKLIHSILDSIMIVATSIVLPSVINVLTGLAIMYDIRPDGEHVGGDKEVDAGTRSIGDFLLCSFVCYVPLFIVVAAFSLPFFLHIPRIMRFCCKERIHDNPNSTFAPDRNAYTELLDQNGPPHNLICPITKDIMDDPVQLANGQSYDRNAIAIWFIDHDTDPLTNERLENKELTTNYALKRIIDDYRGRQRARATDQASPSLIV